MAEGGVIIAPDIQAGKKAFKRLRKAFGDQDAVAAEFLPDVKRAQQKISDMENQNLDVHPSLWLIDALEDCTVGLPGWPHVTSWLARRRGGLFVRLPETLGDPDVLSRSLAELAAEFGDVARAVSTSLGGDSEGGPAVTHGEAERTLAELDQMDAVSARLRLALERLAAR